LKQVVQELLLRITTTTTTIQSAPVSQHPKCISQPTSKVHHQPANIQSASISQHPKCINQPTPRWQEVDNGLNNPRSYDVPAQIGAQRV
jgi:hypothetical protein